MKVTNIVDTGSIVLVELTELEPYRTEAVYFDPRMFRDLAESYDYDFTDAEFDSDGEALWPSS